MQINTADIKKILIIRLSSIGDIILTSPFVRVLRKKFPESYIDFVIKEEYLDLMKTNPNLNDVISYDKRSGSKGLRKIKQYIRSNKYDLVIDLHKNFRSVYLRSFLGSTNVTKYEKNYFNRQLLVWFGINRFDEIIPVYKKYFHAGNKLGIEYDDSGTEVFVTEREQKKAKQVLKKNGYNFDRPLVMICPGAGFAAKRWKPEGYVEAADHLAKKHKAFIGLLGGREDSELCGSIQNNMQKRAVNFAGEFNLLGSAALLKESSLVITNDTGMLHLAQSQKRPVIGVYGPTTRELGYFPLTEKSFVIQHEISCRPCTHNGSNKCPKKHFKCMEEIKIEDLIKSAEQLLESERISSGKDNDKNLVSSL
ncbi:MAG: lipopolysaccharide heptosyltransferase II [bacterium]|nr:lipopolysaccharide heptosyltransferase II [bacterium]